MSRFFRSSRAKARDAVEFILKVSPRDPSPSLGMTETELRCNEQSLFAQQTRNMLAA
jgi:hypothetical protein